MEFCHRDRDRQCPEPGDGIRDAYRDFDGDCHCYAEFNAHAHSDRDIDGDYYGIFLEGVNEASLHALLQGNRYHHVATEVKRVED